jgi:ribonuclease HII
LHHWVRDFRVGEASAAEIDEFGLTAALRLAGRRALARALEAPDHLILDGSFDWMSDRDGQLVTPDYPDVMVPPVATVVKADRYCASVAAASVLAKVHRDDLVRQMATEYPGYEIESNVGYASPAHLAALGRLGPSREHRRSWRLPTTGDV